jgi:3-hydroxyisobutyrate dehydrogenase
MKIGFIGLGAMGRPMAANLLRAGHTLQAYDLRSVEGFSMKPSVAEAARGCEVLFTSLPGPAEVQAVASQVQTLNESAAWFDLSTNSPQTVRSLHAELGKRKIHFLDAPVSGGPKGAQSGKLAIWVGGNAEVYKMHEAVLRQVGDQPYYVGPIGAGTVAKLAHNAASFTVQAALAEVFTLRLAHKDVSLALELAQQCGVPMRVGRIAFEELDEAMKRGWSERDCRVAMTLQEERAAVSVRVPPELLKNAVDE